LLLQSFKKYTASAAESASQFRRVVVSHLLSLSFFVGVLEVLV
jgi:hypothetical protein